MFYLCNSLLPFSIYIEARIVIHAEFLFSFKTHKNSFSVTPNDHCPHDLILDVQKQNELEVVKYQSIVLTCQWKNIENFTKKLM